MSRYKQILRSHAAFFWLLIFFAFIYSYVSVVKHDKFQSFAWDLAFFDELIWKVSQGIEPRSSFNNLHLLGDHFQPVIIIFAPLYWIVSDVRILLVAHAVVATLGVLPVYLLAKKILRHELLSLTVSVSFLLFTPFQHAVLDGFHQSVFTPLFIGWMYYFLEAKRSKGFWLATLGLILTKEEFALIVTSIGLVCILFYGRIRTGLIAIVIGLISFFLIIYLIIPYFQKGPYTHFGYGILGNTPDEVILNILLKPHLFVNLLFSSEKIRTVISSFFAFGFLPLLSPIHLLPVIQQYGVRFVDTVTIHRAANLNHYSFPLAPLLSVATIYSLKTISANLLSKKVLAVYILVCTLAQNIFLHGPLNSLLKKQFFETEAWERDAAALVKQVPDTVVITSQNSLLPHFSQRPKFYLLPQVENAQYLAVDLHDGPNKYSPIDQQRTRKIVENLLATNRFEVIWRQGNSLLLKRID